MVKNNKVEVVDDDFGDLVDAIGAFCEAGADVCKSVSRASKAFKKAKYQIDKMADD